MGTNTTTFREEDLILDQIDQVGRLDNERELYRLVNVLNDVLIEYSNLTPQEVEPVYFELKKRMEREYYKTKVIDLYNTEMKVWHLSMFSSIEYLQKLLVHSGFDQPEDIIHKFDDILEHHFKEQLELFSEKHDISDLSNRLPDPEVFLKDDLEVHYWYDMSREKREFTGGSKGPHWQTESKSGLHELEVQM